VNTEATSWKPCHAAHSSKENILFLDSFPRREKGPGTHSIGTHSIGTHSQVDCKVLSSGGYAVPHDPHTCFLKSVTDLVFIICLIPTSIAILFKMLKLQLLILFTKSMGFRPCGRSRYCCSWRICALYLANCLFIVSWKRSENYGLSI
jgi:hypothetical protein